MGHIDLLARISYIEVPEKDAEKVIRALNGATYRNRTVRCNDADDTNSNEKRSKRRGETEPRNRSQRGQRKQARYESGRKDDWRQFINNPNIKLVGDEPDFSEEGWARRKPRKKK